MLRVLYLYRNLTRNLLRTGLTCAAVAFPITIYVLSTATVDGIDKFLDNSAKQLRLAVTHKASIINPLPTSYVAKIRALDPERRRIVSVAGLRWIGGKMPDNPTPLSTIALEADTFVPTFPEHQLTQAEIDAWHRDRQAMVVGKGTAAKLGWKVGNRVTMMPSLPPYRPLEFHVISLAEKSTDAITLWCRRDYVYEEFKKAGFDDDIIGFLFVKCASAADMNYVRGAIDELFANAPDATKTQDEKTFMSEFINQQFNLPRNLTILSWVTVFVAVMASANTMSMNFRDRMNELAILKSVGFGNWLVVGMIQAEGLALCLAGGLVGALIPYVAFMHTPLRNYTVPLIMHLDIDPVVCVHALGVSLLIGAVAAFWPSWHGLRLTVIAALRNME